MEALYELSNLQCRLDVKLQVDSGGMSAVSTDVSGTYVAYNKAFKAVNSVTGTAAATSQQTAVIDFSAGPNPTGFYVFLFNSAGTRVSGPVSWMARGVV